MKRLAVCLALSPLVFACRDGTVAFPDSGPDTGPAYPDARVIDRIDSGPQGPEVPPPTVTNVSPASGPETGGTRITLRGTAFAEPAEVFFGGAPATGVVVLDEASIAATTPAGTIGPVEVLVRTPGGESALPNGFRYHRDLRITAITPARIPEEGGVPIRIEGRGFDASTLVLIGRKPLIGARVQSAEVIEGYAPALSPGRPEVHALTKEAEDRRSDLLLVYGTPEITSLAPGYGPLDGSDQALLGSGFDNLEQLRVWIRPAVRFSIVDGDRVELFPAPVPAEGSFDVVAASRDAQDTLPGGYVAYDPRLGGQAIVGVTPDRATTKGGQVVAVVGRGFAAGATVRIAGVPAVAASTDLPHAVLVVVPAGLPVGPQDVTVTIGATVLTAPGAITIDPALEITAITPNSGPAAGGTMVTVTGAGFVAGVEVRVGDVPLSNVSVVSDTELSGTIVAGAHGAQDVVVKSDTDRAVLEDGFTFTEPFEVIRIDPVEGSIAGNTLVSVLGRGFSGTASVGFGGVAGVDPRIENGSVLTVRTQPARSGVVDVEVLAGFDTTLLEDAYTFYDPRLVTGGVWGGPIQGSVNVGVVDINSGAPMPNVVVQLGYDADLRYAALTDENGLATISSPEIQGPQTITAGFNGIEFVTYAEVNARNVTMFSSPHPRSQPPDAPRPPCPTGGTAPLVRGRVFKFKSSIDPVTRPGWVPVARITYTDANVFSPNPPEPPEQVDFVFNDGGEYEIVVMRAGTVAVYAIMGDFNQETQEFIPRKLGFVRSVPASADQIVEGINISLEYDLDRQIDLRLDDPPVQTPGPSLNAVFPFLNLGSDGVIPFNPSLVPEGFTIRLTGLPEISAAEFFYMSGSFTLGQTGALTNPYSLTLAQSDDDGSDGLDLGPFLRMPEDVTPKLGQVAENGLFTWSQPGLRPDLTSIFVVDSTAVSACCCIDINQNGVCEATEPEQCGGAPVQFTRWSIFGPGGLQSYAMPAMPPGIQAFEPPKIYPWVTQQALAPRFNYSEWIYNQYSPFFWKSWTVSVAQFLAKEQTD